jgi:uncharacterized oxidoreductase
VSVSRPLTRNVYTFQVLELIPPYVQTELQGARQATDPNAIDPNAMPLTDYINETMSILETSPDAPEILVERVKRQRFAEATGAYEAVFNRTNPA